MFENSSFSATKEVFNTSSYSFYVSTIYVCMAVIGIIGNIVTCTIIIANKFMHTPINCYLFNLTISDTVILFMLFPLHQLIPLDSTTNCQLG